MGLFPEQPLPKLCIVQLSKGAECLLLQSQETPWWMLPEGVHQQLLHISARDETAELASTDEAAAAKLSPGPAEELLAEYGQDGRKSRRKGRRP